MQNFLNYFLLSSKQLGLALRCSTVRAGLAGKNIQGKPRSWIVVQVTACKGWHSALEHRSESQLLYIQSRSLLMCLAKKQYKMAQLSGPLLPSWEM